jgi:hypothetical protein
MEPMPEDDAETLRAKLERAEARAARAELALEGPKRAAEAGVPGELVHTFVGSPLTVDEIREWVEEKLNPYVEAVTERELREQRPDLFRGRGMSLQHARVDSSTGTRPPRPGENGRS